MELSLLDAFRAAQEPEPYESPPTADLVEGPRSAFGRPHRELSKKGSDKKGFLHRLHKDTRGVFGGLFRTRTHTDETGIPEDGLPPKSHRSTHSFDSLGIPPAPLGPVYDGLPITPDRPTLGQSTGSTPYVYSSIDTHLETLATLEKLKLSTTPGLTIPAPILLQRVKKEEELRLSDAARVNSGAGTPRSEDLDNRPSGYRLGGDVRTGLKSMRSGIDTFEGWTRLQRLDTIRCVAVDESRPDPNGTSKATFAVCDRPQAETLIFYDPETDTSLASLLQTLKAEMSDMAACSRSGCVATAYDHKRCWYHGEKKVTLRAKHTEESVDRPEESLRTWVSCPTCGSASDSKRMSDVAS